MMEHSDISEEVDSLLADYLERIDEYDKLRRKLCDLQISAQQHLARANFSAARGIRYGEELYDSRMQALRLCRVTKDVEKFKIVIIDNSKDNCRVQADLPIQESATQMIPENSDGPSRETTIDQVDMKKKIDDPTSSVGHNSIRMFGILTPQSLRLAQADSIMMVGLIPRLVEVKAELAEIESSIYHIRKYRPK